MTDQEKAQKTRRRIKNIIDQLPYNLILIIGNWLEEITNKKGRIIER